MQQYCNAQKVEVSGGCQYITGEGLTPLQGSSVLEQIDISLVGKHRHPEIELEPMISEAPILHTNSREYCFATDGCSLKYMQVPKKWRIDPRGHCLLC